MDFILLIVALLFALLGLVGAIVPLLPGPILSFVAVLFLYFIPGVDLGSLWLWLGACVVITAADCILPGYATKLFGGSRAGIIGATLGVIVGLVGFPPYGVLMGPFVGAVMGELMQDKRDVGRAFKVGFGSFVAFIVGTGIKFVYGLYAIGAVVDVVRAVVPQWVDFLN